MAYNRYLMWTVCNIVFAAVFTLATAWAIGTLLLCRLSTPLYRVEKQLLAGILGSACLSTLVFVLCIAGFARKGVFLALGLVAIAAAVRFRARTAREPLSPRPLPARLSPLYR